ncbi:MAG: hypothetical protein GY862_27995 [Gammaproteobacteria bacterium]|nr:hypothetical protein [Gammaproteobacteria bacterium]
MQTPAQQKVRLDKWLWAARFYKTRSLAAAAVTNGKVRVNGQPAKPAKELQAGCRLILHINDVERTVIVRALSTRRGPASEAVLLYEETPESIEGRMAAEQRRREARAQRPHGSGRPTKKDRRAIHRFTGKDTP